MTNANVIHINDVENDKKSVVYKMDSGNEDAILVDKVIFAVGRVGSGFFSDWCLSNGVNQRNNQVDIGVRVELPSVIWEDFEKKIYEPKILYRSHKYGDTIRMFCFNGRGEVVEENTNGIFCFLIFTLISMTIHS